MNETSQYQLLQALAIARWQILVNSMRSERSKRQDAAANIIAGLVVAVVAASLGFGLAGLTYGLSKNGSNQGVVAALWIVFILWLFLQLVASASGGLSFREIARYPLTLRSYCLLQAGYWFLEPATPVALFWLLCVWVAFAFARPAAVVRSTLLLAGFGLVALLLNRLLSELIERITSTKKGRRRLIATMISFSLLYQFVVFGNHRVELQTKSLPTMLGAIPRYLPPGIATQGLREGSLLQAAGLLAIYVALLGLPLFWIYLRKYQGELLSDGPAAAAQKGAVPGWRFPLLSNPMAALIEKEFRYVLSQPLGWLTWCYGPMMTLLMSLGMFRAFRIGREFIFPGVVAWVMLVVGARAYNCFGFDMSGFNRYLLAPQHMRQVIGSKNLAVALILGFNFLGSLALFLWVAPSAMRLFLPTLAGFLFTTLATLSAGNFLSVRFPMAVDIETMRAKNVSTAGQLGNMLIQMTIAAVLGAVFLLKLPALPVFMVLSVGAGALYWVSLDDTANYVTLKSEEISRSLSG
jgi:hypothetical protein